MKKLNNYILGIFSIVGILFMNNSFAQCSFTVSPLTATVSCGETVDFVGQGYTTGPVLSEDFNNQTLGPGWQSTQTMIYSNPCGPSLDGTPSAWMGSTATQPRILTTTEFDLSCGAEVCFDLDFAADDNTSGNCEDPDQFDEGVHFEYSTDGGATWTEIFYFEANTANNLPWYQWDNYCFTIPSGAWSSTTMFRWRQIVVSGVQYDHWGIDNVVIQPFDCGSAYYYEWDGALGDNDTTMQFTSTSTFDVIYTNGIDDTCSETITVTVNPLNANASATDLNLSCGDCTDLFVDFDTPPNIPNPNYTYTWSPSGTLNDPALQNPEACPADTVTYTGIITETNSGCTAAANVTINGGAGSAVADFTTSADSGCAPLDIVFTNNSVGNNYTWDFGDGNTSTQQNPTHTYTSQGTYIVSLTAELGGSCPDSVMTDTIVVAAVVVPNADFDYTVVCGEPIVDFTNNSTGNLDYLWEFGDGDTDNSFEPSHTYPGDGNYTVTLTVTDPTCGTNATYTEDISIVDNPVIINYGDPSCYQFSDGSITVNTSVTDPSVTFSVIDTNGVDQTDTPQSGTANLLSAGEYHVIVDFGGCLYEEYITLEQPPQLIADLSIDDVDCYGDASGSAIVDTVYNYHVDGATNYQDTLDYYNDLSYIWAPDPDGATGLGIAGGDTSQNMPAGDYQVSVTDSYGCVVEVNFTINQPAEPLSVQTTVDPALCRESSLQNGNGVLTAQASGGTPGYDFLWENLDNGNVTANTTWGALNPGQYQISVLDANNCLITEIVTLDSINPIADFLPTSSDFATDYEGTSPVSVVFTNQSVNYEDPNNPNDQPTFIWNLNEGVASNIITDDFNYSPDTTYDVGGEYIVCLTTINKNGCEDSICKPIIVFDPLEFEPVNVFTPNGDQINDVFTFKERANAVAEFSCIITNRWGRVVAEFDDISDEWDGTDQGGKVVPNGVYFYTYSGVADNGTVFEGQGTVTLVDEE